MLTRGRSRGRDAVRWTSPAARCGDLSSLGLMGLGRSRNWGTGWSWLWLTMQSRRSRRGRRARLREPHGDVERTPIARETPYCDLLKPSLRQAEYGRALDRRDHRWRSRSCPRPPPGRTRDYQNDSESRLMTLSGQESRVDVKMSGLAAIRLAQNSDNRLPMRQVIPPERQ